MVEVYAAHFTHGDRHANAHDDTETQLSLRRSVATAAIPPKKCGGICFSLESWDISLALNMTYYLSPIVGFADTSPEGGSAVCFTVFASVAKQTPGRVSFRKVIYFFT